VGVGSAQGEHEAVHQSPAAFTPDRYRCGRHPQISWPLRHDRVLLEFDLPDKDAGRGTGLKARATLLANYALQHPEITTAEEQPITEAIVARALQIFRENGAMSSNVSDVERNVFMSMAQRDGIAFEAEPFSQGGQVKRDKQLMRELLLRLEALPMRAAGCVSITPDAEEIAVPGYSCQRRSDSRPAGRSKSRPVGRCEFRIIRW